MEVTLAYVIIICTYSTYSTHTVLQPLSRPDCVSADEDLCCLTDWETYMEEYIQVMQEQEENDNVTWPQDSLFKYYEYLQKLQYNLDERNAQMIVGGER
ncbi:CTSR2 protein, partial [Amia calva]|nr:CTSR2 protein [Amia calva]